MRRRFFTPKSLRCGAFALAATGAPAMACETKSETASDAPAEEISPAPKLDVGAPVPTAVEARAEGRSEGRGLAAITRDVVDDAQAKPTDPLSLLPTRAVLVGQMRPTQLYDIEDFAKVVEFFATKIDDDTTHAVARMAACQLDPAKIESVTIGVDGDSDGALVVRGPGVGDADRWRCLRTELVTAGHTPEFDIKDEGGTTVMRNGADGGRFVDENTFVFFDEHWENEVVALIDKRETTSVLDSGLAAVIARVKLDEPMWFAMELTPDQRSELASGPMAGITQTWGALSAGEELALTVAGKADSPDAAEKMRATVDEQWQEVKGMVSAFGMPASFSSKVEFKATGDAVSMHVRASHDEAATLASAIANL